MPLSRGAIAALTESVECTGNVARVKDQLPVGIWNELSAAFNKCQGKFVSRKSSFKFPYDAQLVVDSLIVTGDANPTAFYATPVAVVEQMMEYVCWPNIPKGVRILEPSAGTGRILKGIVGALDAHYVSGWHIDAVDVLARHAILLHREFEGYEGVHVHHADFMQWAPEELYDLVFMNPPFSLKTDNAAYSTHIRRAFRMLKPGGALIAIAPHGWTFHANGEGKKFREFVAVHGGYVELPPGTFNESGTGVATNIIRVSNGNRTVDEGYGDGDGFSTNDTGQAAMLIANVPETYALLPEAIRTRIWTPLWEALHADLEGEVNWHELLEYFAEEYGLGEARPEPIETRQEPPSRPRGYTTNTGEVQLMLGL